jgi:hypothetical protein
LFGLACNYCHSTIAWSPAELVQHPFPVDHGMQGLNACEVCHTERYTDYTCFGCHQHQEAEIIQLHPGELLLDKDLRDCAGCHTGDGGIDDPSGIG